MGCDIHIMVEKLVDGKWTAVKGVNPDIARNRYYAELNKKRGEVERAENYKRIAMECESGETLRKTIAELEKQYPESKRLSDPELQKEYESELEYELGDKAPEVYRDWIYDGRNYDLFAILADVRNGRGFAGVVTGEGFIPIFKPRGVPENASEEYRKWSDDWDGDGHSHSYHTVRQLINFQHWKEDIIHYGIVTEEEYKIFKEKGMPESYCGGMSGPDIVEISNESLEAIISGEAAREADKHYITRVQWKEGYWLAVGGFYTESIPKLRELARDDLDSVRIVFFFDN